MLAYHTDDNPARVMVSPRPDGQDASLYAAGFWPVWFSTGRTFLFGSEGNLVASATPPARPNLFPEIDAQKILMGVDATEDGTEVAIQYSGPMASKVALFEYPSKRLKQLWSLTGDYYGIHYASDGSLIMPFKEGKDAILGKLTPEGRMVRLWKTTAGRSWTRRVHGGDVLLSMTRHDYIELPTRDGTVRRVRAFRRMNLATSRRGDRMIFTAENDDHGSHVMLYLIDQGILRRLTDGPRDASAVLTPNGKQFAYAHGDSAEIRLCHVDEPSSCRVLARGSRFTTALAFSPAGTMLAYEEGHVSQSYRLRVANLQGGPAIDLGPSLPQCWLRWTSETRLWSFDRDKRRWSEFDVVARAPTGITAEETEVGDFGCPAHPGDDGSDAPKFGQDSTTTVWFAPAEARIWDVK
jgi:hypothetical protein